MDPASVVQSVLLAVAVGGGGWGLKKIVEVLLDIRDKVTVLVVKVDNHGERLAEVEEDISFLKGKVAA